MSKTTPAWPRGQADNLAASPDWGKHPDDVQHRLSALLGEATETKLRFDRVCLYVENRLPSKGLIADLRDDASSVDVHPPEYWWHHGRWIWNPHSTMVIVAAGDDAMQALAAQPWEVSKVEPAKDRLFASAAEPPAAHALFNAHFVHLHHGPKHQMCVYVDEATGFSTTYTSQRAKGAKRVFLWYSDRPEKRSGEPYCFHLESRISDPRSIGIHAPPDLLTFRHAAFWREFERLEAIDHERLARLDSNRRNDERRRHTRDDDLSAGLSLAHLLSRHPDPRQHLQSVQIFIDAYGRGPFLRRLHIPLFTRPITAV